ncbi:NAD(P)-dependent oxidoreductase [Skermanella rosea]|uniref:NAD(P)-dependent oxidoreductase n=1 Tax=Skermanella rosea TaxID=1817965 RepID=UPI0019333105
MGAIGRAIAGRLAGFGADLVFWDRRPADAAAGIAPGLRRLDRADLFATSDILVVALPLTDGTLHLIDRAALATVKPGALLVNPARGSVVDEAAVADALAAGHLGGYAADVFEMEDWARPDRPRGVDPRLLADRDRTLFTPHPGSAVGRVRLAIEREAAANIIDVLEGRAPRGAVNRPDAAALGLRAGTAGC